MNIYVGNLDFEVTDTELKEMFESFGTIINARIIKDRFTGQSRGFGFVVMENKDEALAAIEQMNGKEVKGKNLTVNEARPKRDNMGGGGRPRNGGGGSRGGFGNKGGGRNMFGGSRGGGKRF